MDEEIEALRAEIEQIIERIDDLSFRVLSEAAQNDEIERPDLDRQLIRARRALERAARILSVAR